MQRLAEQRVNVKFLKAEGKSQAEVLCSLRAVYGAAAMSKSSVQYWYSRFESSDVSTKDKDRSGRPRSGRSAANIEAVEQLILQDRRVSIPRIQRTLSLTSGTEDRIIHQDLKFRRVSAKFIPKVLSEEQKKNCLEVCLRNLELYEHHDTFIQEIITGDESSFMTFRPETKAMSMQWIRKGERRPKKALRCTTKKSTMLTVFFDINGIMHAELKQPKERITSDAYCHTLARLREKIRVKRPEQWKANNYKILHDNAKVHTTHHTVTCMMETQMETVEHPPYSPDLAPTDFFHFVEAY